MKIGYQGIEGAYSEAAIYQHYGKGVKPLGYGTFEEVFEAVKKGRVDLGCLPFENTIAGSITRNYDLLLKENVSVIAEIFFRVSHNLLSHKGNKLANIKVAYSHPHSLEQCQEFLRKHKIKPMPEYDTAGAAKLVKERKRKEEEWLQLQKQEMDKTQVQDQSSQQLIEPKTKPRRGFLRFLKKKQGTKEMGKQISG